MFEENDKYLTYDEYKFLGGSLDIIPFNLYEEEAKIIIKRETQNRLNNVIPKEVKMCMFKLINGFAFDGNYKDSNSQEKNEYINNIIYDCLSGVIYNNQVLLYRGI